MPIGGPEVYGALAVRTEDRRAVCAENVQNAERIHDEQGRLAVAGTSEQGRDELAAIAGGLLDAEDMRAEGRRRSVYRGTVL